MGRTLTVGWSSRFLTTAILAVVVSLGGGTDMAGASRAAAAPIGNVTCQGSGHVSFAPALTPEGVRGGHEKVTFSEQLRECQGPPGTHVPPRPLSVTTAPIELPATTVHGSKVIGDCGVLGRQLSNASTEQSIKWGGRILEQSFSMASRLMEQEGIYYFFEHSNKKHTLIDALGLASTSSRALTSCIDGSGHSLARVSFNPIISLVTDGTTVLTTGSLKGANIGFGDQFSAGVSGGPTCGASSSEAVVQRNPTAPGTAALRLESLTYSACTIFMGAAVGTLEATVTANDLPYSMSVGDGSSDPATLGPMSLTIAVNGDTSSCTYTSATPLKGSFDDSTSSITFSGSLALSGAIGPLAAGCPTSPLSAPKFTSIADEGKTPPPRVYVN
jgi:hypothetical protein